MAGTDLVPVEHRSSFDLLPAAREMADAIAKTEFVPRALRNRPDAVMAAVLAGHEMGLPPMQALSKIHIIDGRPAPAAEVMRAVVLQTGHDLWIEETSITKATVCGRRRGSDHTTRVTWTMDDAKRANLVGKDNWRKYPRAMLLARATAELCRMVFPDVLGGLTYAVEEVQDGFTFDAIEAEAELVDDAPAGQPAAPPVTHTRKAARATAKKAAPRKTAAASAAAKAPPPAPPLPNELDDDTAPATPPPASQPAGQSPSWAQQIAMRCREIDVDRHQLIRAVTGGRKDSGRDLDEAEAHDALEAIRLIKNREMHIVDGDPPLLEDGPGYEPFPDDDTEVEAEVVDGRIVTRQPGQGDQAEEVGWSLDDWRARMKASGCNIGETLRQARAIAAEKRIDLPSSLEDLCGNEVLAPAIRAWMDETAVQRGKA